MSYGRDGTLVLTRSELDRMRNSLNDNDSAMQSTTRRKAELQRLSQERVKNWPNTLEALRRKKENFAKDREAIEEQARQEIDRQEAELRRNERLAVIKKANDMLYDQTDQMKLLRSQKLYADVVYERKQQEKYRQEMKKAEKKDRDEYHQVILQKVAEGELKELAEAEKKKVLLADIKSVREIQREEARQRREAEISARREEGERLKKEAYERIEEELREAEAKQRHAIESNNRMKAANEELRVVRMELREAERLADLAREAETEKIEDRKAQLKRLDAARFARSQETRQRLIDRAVKLLAEKTNREEEILEAQMAEIRDREDREAAEKVRKTEERLQLMASSRREQIAALEENRRREQAELQEMMERWKLENSAAQQREDEANAKAYATTKTLKREHYSEAQTRAAARRAEKEAEIAQTKFLQSLSQSDDKRFVDACKAEIERNIAAGKPIYTLLRALEYHQPDMLAAKTIKIAHKPKSAPATN